MRRRGHNSSLVTSVKTFGGEDSERRKVGNTAERDKFYIKPPLSAPHDKGNTLLMSR